MISPLAEISARRSRKVLWTAAASSKRYHPCNSRPGLKVPSFPAVSAAGGTGATGSTGAAGAAGAGAAAGCARTGTEEKRQDRTLVRRRVRFIEDAPGG